MRQPINQLVFELYTQNKNFQWDRGRMENNQHETEIKGDIVESLRRRKQMRQRVASREVDAPKITFADFTILSIFPLIFLSQQDNDHKNINESFASEPTKSGF